MKRIYVFAYNRMNLGDDIFLNILFCKYINIHFYLSVLDKVYFKPFLNFKNVHLVENDYRDLEKVELNKYDACIYIGGSIFIENKRGVEIQNRFDKFLDSCNMLNKPFFYVSSNFGPYQTQEYFEICKSTIKKASDICFREKYSTNLFSDLPHVRYAPDLVFCYDISKSNEEKNSIGISVIDFEIRANLNKFAPKYFDLLVNSIKKYIKSGKKVYLFSFCQYEGDELGISKILDRMLPEEVRKIEVVKYNGDIVKFINVYKKMEYMICTRFHSMILSAICNQKMYCVSYSKKMNNVNLDLSLEINIRNIDDIESTQAIELNLFRKINVETIENIKKQSLNQLKEFDKFVVTG